MMEYVKIGSGELSASRIVMGCEQLGGTDWGTIQEGEVARAVGRALDLGVNAFDTADVYGLGRSEERLADALGPRRREAVIITKFGVAWKESASGGRAETRIDNSEAHMRRALEASLRRLRLDAIPVYLVHKPDPETPLEETIETLNEFKREGKIRYFGVSNFSAGQIAAASALGPVALAQMEYSLLNRGAEAEALPRCAALGVGAMAYGVLGFGILSGKYGVASSFEKSDRRERLPAFRGEEYRRSLHVVER